MAGGSVLVGLRHRLEAVAAGGWLGLMKRLSPGLRTAVAGRLGEWARYLDRRHARNARDSLALRYGERGVGRKVRAVYRELGCLAGEIALLETRDPEELSALVRTIEGREYLEATAADPRGVLMVGAHMGNWELLGHLLPLYGFRPLNVVYRRLDNPLLDQRLRRSRELHGARAVDRESATRPVLGALRRGEAVALLMDQHTRGQGTVRMPFLGEVTNVSTAPARFALQTGCPILSMVLVREGPDRFRLVVYPPLEPGRFPDNRQGLEALTAQTLTLMEAGIAEAPEQWFWVHSRWRERPRRLDPNAAPPPAWNEGERWGGRRPRNVPS